MCIKSILNCFLHDLKSIMASRRGNGRSDRGPKNLFCICGKNNSVSVAKYNYVFVAIYNSEFVEKYNPEFFEKYRLLSFFCCNYFENSQCKFCVLR